MAGITVRDDDIELDSPTLVEGMPGVGLVGKIATDYLIDDFDMRYYASVSCEGLPRISVYHPDDRASHPPVRLYADPDRDLLALQSEVPVSAESATSFATCVTGFLERNDVTPIYLSGRPAEKDGTPPNLYGVSTGGAGARLDELGISVPDEHGAIAGPTGALLAEADDVGLDSYGLVVGCSPQFPDPEAASVLLTEGIGPLGGFEIDVSTLVDRAEEIQDTRQQLAQQLQEAGDDESTKAGPIRMFQ